MPISYDLARRLKEAEFGEKCKRWTKSQREGGACACLGDCQICGWHQCHGCLCSLKPFLFSTIDSLLEEKAGEIESLKGHYSEKIDPPEWKEIYAHINTTVDDAISILKGSDNHIEK